MNLINKTLIDLLISSAETLRNEICNSLEKYRKDIALQKRISERYKDEQNYYREQQTKLAAIAREEIAKAERVFTTKVNDYTKQMEEQLKKHLAEPVNPQFREKLSLLADFGIQPEKIEVEDLIQKNGGNQLGLTALAKTLEKVDSPYVLKYHTTADYQNDIESIRNITMNMKYIPAEYHHEGCEIYKGIRFDQVLPNGAVLHGGLSFDSIALITCRIGFENTIESIKQLKDVWSADCSYTEADQNSLGQNENKPISGTSVEGDKVSKDVLNIAREIGQQKAKTQVKVSDVFKQQNLI